MVLLTRGRSQDRHGNARSSGDLQITTGSRVVVLNGRHFPAFGAGDEGVVLQVDQEAQNCNVLFHGKGKAVQVALRHLRLTAGPQEAEEQAFVADTSATCEEMWESAAEAIDINQLPQVEEQPVETSMCSQQALEGEEGGAFGDTPGIEEIESSMLRADISTDWSVARGNEDAVSSPVRLHQAMLLAGGRSVAQAVEVLPVFTSPSQSRMLQSGMLSSGGSGSCAAGFAQANAAAAAAAAANAAASVAAMQSSGLLQGGYAQAAPNGMQIFATPGPGGGPAFGAQAPQLSGSPHFEMHSRLNDSSSLSMQPEVPAFHQGGMAGLPPAQTGYQPAPGWASGMFVPPAGVGAPFEPNATARGATLESLELRLVSIEEEHQEKVTSLRNALEECIRAMSLCPEQPEAGSPDDVWFAEWERASTVLRSAADFGSSVLRATALGPPASNLPTLLGSGQPMVTRSASCSGLIGRGRACAPTPVDVEVVGSNGQWDLSWSSRELHRARSGSPSNGQVGAGQRQRYMSATPSGKISVPPVYRDTSNGLSAPSAAGPVGGSPGPASLLTPGRPVRQSPGGTPGQQNLSAMHLFPGWGNVGPSGTPGPRASPGCGSMGMLPPPSGQRPSPPAHMMGAMPGGPMGPPGDALSLSCGQLPGLSSLPGGHGGWHTGGDSAFAWSPQPGMMPPPLPGMGLPGAQPGAGGLMQENFMGVGPMPEQFMG